MSHKRLTFIYLMLLCIAFFLVFESKITITPEGYVSLDILLRICIYCSLVIALFAGIATWYRLKRWQVVLLFIAEIFVLSGFAFFVWYNLVFGLSVEVKLCLTAFAPAFFSIILVRFALKSRTNMVDNTRWRDIEDTIKDMGPQLNTVALIADIIGFLVAFNLMPMCLRALLLLTFAFATTALMFTFVNWYVTKLVFKHETFELENEKISLVASQRHRLFSWFLLNITFMIFIWVIWGVLAIAFLYAYSTPT